MNKKYISLGLLAATALCYVIGPIVSLFGFGVTSLDLLGELGSAGLGDYLLIFIPIVAIVLGVLGVFAKPALVKIGGLVGGIGYAVAVILQLLAAEFELAIFGWGLWALLALLVANLVLTLKAE